MWETDEWSSRYCCCCCWWSYHRTEQTEYTLEECHVQTSFACCLIWQQVKPCNFFSLLVGLNQKKKWNKYESLTSLRGGFSQKNKYTKKISNPLPQTVPDVGQFPISITFSSKLTWVLAKYETASFFSIITSHLFISPILQTQLFHRNISRPRWIFAGLSAFGSF